MKIGIHIVNQLHDITQEDFVVSFHSDFAGMIRIEFTKEYDEKFYEHEHLGYPDCPRDILEQKIIESLNSFREEHLCKK